MTDLGKCNDIFCKHNTNRQCECSEVWIEYGDGVAFCDQQNDDGWEKRVEKIDGKYSQKK
jgi:hypothetical protein